MPLSARGHYARSRLAPFLKASLTIVNLLTATDQCDDAHDSFVRLHDVEKNRRLRPCNLVFFVDCVSAPGTLRLIEDNCVLAGRLFGMLDAVMDNKRVDVLDACRDDSCRHLSLRPIFLLVAD